MKIIILLFAVLSSFLFASINEYKSDLYYANGIMINISEKEATKIWDQKVKELFLDKQESYKKLERIQVSYNRSQGFFDNLFESLEQKISNEFGWKEVSEAVRWYLETKGYQESFDAHTPDLAKQVASYKQSIKDGHGVIVIAHSQGNYYTNEAYELLDEWMREYFHMFGVATPANHVAGFAAGDITAPYVKFHNDFIKAVIGGLDSNMDNPNQNHNSLVSIAAHDFYESYLKSENSKAKILNFIELKIQEQVDAQSQWATDEEFDKETKDYRITVKHIYDTDIVMDEKVYPFKPSAKLYPVSDPLNPKETVYVKASFGGERILSADDVGEWEAEDDQFYKLEGTDPVEYIEGETCKDPSNFEIISHQNEKTADWRVSVKNRETNEVQSDVYPFNINGSLYQLENGDWVIASCGGTEILSSWSDQQDNEVYKLIGTNNVIDIRFKRDHINDIVTDYKIDLQWQDTQYTWLDSWYGAVRHCTNLTLGGYDDWRLPDYNELIQILDLDGPPYIYDIFEHLGQVGHWTTQREGVSLNTEVARVVNFQLATWIDIKTSYHMNTRCVRTKN